MAVGDVYVFPGFLTPVLTQLFFPKPPTTFLTCFCRGKGQKYAGKKSPHHHGWNSQPPGHESDTFTTEPPGRGGPFVDSVDQDKTAQNMQALLGLPCPTWRDSPLPNILLKS